MNEFMDMMELYEIESVDTRGTVLEIIPKLYDYIVVEEFYENPYTAPYAVTTTNWSLHFSEEALGHTINTPMGGINILRYRI